MVVVAGYVNDLVSFLSNLGNNLLKIDPNILCGIGKPPYPLCFDNRAGRWDCASDDLRTDAEGKHG